MEQLLQATALGERERQRPPWRWAVQLTLNASSKLTAGCMALGSSAALILTLEIPLM